MTLSSLQCADVPWGMKVGNTIGTLLVFLAGHLQFLNINIYFFQIKHTEAIHQTALGNWYDVKSPKC